MTTFTPAIVEKIANAIAAEGSGDPVVLAQAALGRLNLTELEQLAADLTQVEIIGRRGRRLEPHQDESGAPF